MNAKKQPTANAVTIFISVTLMFLMLPVQAAGVLKTQKSNTVIDIGMYADYNRDGKIEPGVDTNTKTNPYVFWINDDDDDDDSEARGGFFNGTDTPGEGTSDSTGLASGGIDGTRDLIDFFAVQIDLHSFINQSSDTNTYKYIIKQADSAVNIVYTRLDRQDIGKYLEKINVNNVGELLCKDSCQNDSSTFTLSDVETRQVKNSGFGLPKDFIEMIKSDKNKGVILVEGRSESSAPLVLEILDKDNKKIHLIELPLKLTGAESMYRFINMRGCSAFGLDITCSKSLTGGAVSVEIAKTLALPKNIISSKQVFFVHGFNVSLDASRGGGAEVFKRLFHAGSKAEFNVISWTGDDSIGSYWNNVENAFNTAVDFQYIVGQVTGTDKTVIAHSLGNMMVGSAIQDHGLNIAHYFMLDAAVAIEAYKGDQLAIREMRHPDWDEFYAIDTSYTIGSDPETISNTDFNNTCGRRLWASDWYQLYYTNYTCKSTDVAEADAAFTTPNDIRTGLTWKNRLSAVTVHPGVVQFYSSGEDVVRAAVEGPPGFFEQLSTPFNGGVNAWTIQEKSKGTETIASDFQAGINSQEGGWGFGICGTELDDEFNEIPIFCDSNTPSEAFALHNTFLRQTPFFHELSTINPTVDSTSNEINHLLAYAIPALSFGAGGAPIIVLGTNNRSSDMNAYPGVGNSPDWPSERPLDPNPITQQNRLWHHGDFKDVAYRYVFKLYDEMILRGGLK